MSEHHDGADAASHGGRQPESAAQPATPGYAAAGGQGQSQASASDHAQGAAEQCAAHQQPGYPPGAMPPPWPYDPRWAGYVPQHPAGFPGGHAPNMGYPGWEMPGPQGHGGYGMGQGAGQGYGQGPRMSDVVQEIASGGSGLSSLSRMLNLDDVDFWKGALVGAAAVMLLTNGSVQNALFGQRSSAKAAGGNEEEAPA